VGGHGRHQGGRGRRCVRGLVALGERLQVGERRLARWRRCDGRRRVEHGEHASARQYLVGQGGENLRADDAAGSAELVQQLGGVVHHRDERLIVGERRATPGSRSREAELVSDHSEQGGEQLAVARASRPSRRAPTWRPCPRSRRRVRVAGSRPTGSGARLRPAGSSLARSAARGGASVRRARTRRSAPSRHGRLSG